MILTGVKSLSYAANMQATRIAKARRRRRGAARAARRHRPRGADLDDLLGLARGRPAHARARRGHPRVDHPRRRSCARSTSRRASSRSTTCSARARPSSPRRCARSSRSSAIDGHELEMPGPRTQRGRGGASSAIAGRELAAPRSLEGRVDLDLTDEQRLIPRRRATSPTTRSSRGPARTTAPRASTSSSPSRLGEMGYLGAPVAEEYGGRGLDYLSYGLIVEEVGRGDSSARTVVSVQTSLVCGSIERWGTEEQKRALAAAPLLGRGARLLRPHRARRRLGPGRRCAPGPSRRTAAGGSPARRCGSRSATSPRSR